MPNLLTGNSTPHSHLALSTQTLVLLLCDKCFMHWASLILKCTYLSWSGMVIMKSTWNDSKDKKYPPTITKCYHNNSILLPPLSTFDETWSQYILPMLIWNLLCSPGWPQTSSNSVFCHRRAEVIIEALCHYFWLDNTIFHNSHKHLAKFCTFQQRNLEPQQNSQVWPSGLSRNYLGVLILKTDLGHIPELIKHMTTNKVKKPAFLTLCS